MYLLNPLFKNVCESPVFWSVVTALIAATIVLRMISNKTKRRLTAEQYLKIRANSLTERTETISKRLRFIRDNSVILGDSELDELTRDNEKLGAEIDAIISLLVTRKKRNQTPERLGHLLSFLLPKKIREDAFGPYFEELKEDRLDARRKIHSRAGMVWVEFCFYFRLAVALLQSLLCWAVDIAGKALPLLKLFIKSN